MIDKYTAQAPTTEEAIEKGLKALGMKKDEALIDIVEDGKKGFLGFGHRDAVVTVRRKDSKIELDDIFSKDTTDIKIEKEIENLEEDIKTAQKEEVTPLKEGTKTAEIDDDLEIPEEVQKDALVQEKQDGIDEQAIEDVAEYIVSIAHQMGATHTTVKHKMEDHTVTFTIYSQKAGMLIGRHGKVLNALQMLVQTQLHKRADSKITAIVDAEGYRERREQTLKKLAKRTADKVRKTKQPVILEPMPSFERKQIHRYLSEDKGIETHSEGKDPHRYLVVELSRKKFI
ncbi:RNA-binding cell elongation regulator Jag/EloR [Lacticigenium naphthae]|uniref:RNA-binding cell elongation regulator Jag/EloR n=1 Tax=Lacticigenium naphthae TaxID=515351 RepID=UPI000413D211|nr:RNA-binding cell elongation regulator Jag/EloR [Lacticigenium naphthae]